MGAIDPKKEIAPSVMELVKGARGSATSSRVIFAPLIQTVKFSPTGKRYCSLLSTTLVSSPPVLKLKSVKLLPALPRAKLPVWNLTSKLSSPVKLVLKFIRDRYSAVI